ncbi:uncharacterized protein [Nicotiana tomentosiformis]|uniref:uncharacterized protein n=1 Tax=Nicotiana tomentosiformis TaxID=4098 RepID=UPI00388C64FB
MEDISKTFSSKRWWRLRTTDNLWSNFMNSKYCQRSHPVVKTWDKSQYSAWCDLKKIRKDVEPHILWKINEASIDFWWDNWIGSGPIANVTHLNNKPRAMKVKVCLLERQWNTHMIANLVNANIFRDIANTRIGDRNSKDQPIWKATTSGIFTCSSAFDMLRQRRRKCHCRAQPKDESIEHVFISREIATQCLTTGGAIKEKRDYKEETTIILPNLICWELWKARCSYVYGNRRTNRSRICQQVLYLLKNDLKRLDERVDISWTWEKLWKEMEIITPVLSCRPVIWDKPPDNWLKINSDGSSNILKRRAGIGGIVRNRNGQLIVTYVQNVQFCTNNSVEVHAASCGMKLCKDLNFGNIILEMDSLIVVNMIKGKYKVPWELMDKMETLKDMLQQLQAQVVHCYREGNAVADALSKIGAESQHENAMLYGTMKDLPREVRGLFRMDIIQLPTFRIRQKKAMTNSLCFII